MASDYGLRGKAAAKLGKGKGAPPPEDDLGLPPMEEEGGMPPAPGGEMGGLEELLGQLGGAPGGPEAPPPAGPVDEMAPPGMEDPAMAGAGAPPEPMDLEGALSGVDSSLEGMPPEMAEEIRTHLNAIREIASRGAAGGPPPGMDPMAAAPGAPPAGAAPAAEELPA